MSERHGLTLRKKRNKRPPISGPTTSKPPPTTATNGTERPQTTQRPSATNETTDLIKRRYSTRYNQLPNFSDAPDVPALPGQIRGKSPGGDSARRPGTAHSHQQHPLTVDQSMLADPSLKHDQYVADLLSNASEQDIQDYQNNLQRVKHRTETDIQQSVYQNRTQFIKISKEAERLKGEIGVLRNLMTELTTALGQSKSVPLTNGSASTTSLDGGAAARKAANRTSVANLESMWNTQLQALWKHIEKSQKFLPAVPGRHIVMETGSWLEIDSATWRGGRAVHFVLLNDHLLVASKKRKRLDPDKPNQGPAPTKLVAEECWPLGDIEVIDMTADVAVQGLVPASEVKNIVTALIVRTKNNRSITYRHEKRDEKAKSELLMAYRKAAEDLRKASMPATQDKNGLERANSLNYYASRDPASARNADIINSINSTKDRPDILVEVDGKQQNFRWIESQIDELDIDVALQRFEEAVEKVEKLRAIAKSLSAKSSSTSSTITTNSNKPNSHAIAQELITLRINERAAKVASILYRDLIESPSFIESTKRTTSHLIRLGFEDKAREIYLRTRADNLTARSRQCIFDGDLHKYIFSISYVYFTIVKNTVLIFQTSFPPAMMSACIKWANEQLEGFNSLLVRQLSSVEKGGKTWGECMDVVWAHEREMLGEVGLDFREVIGRGLNDSGVGNVDGSGGVRGRSQSQVTAGGGGGGGGGRSKSRQRGIGVGGSK